MDLSEHHVAIIAIVVAAGSEILSLTPKTRANGWLQLLMNALRTMFPKKK